MKNQSYTTRIDRQVGSRLRERRIELGLTIERLAAALDVPLHVLEKWETGRLRVGAEKLLESAKILSVNPQCFFVTAHSSEWSGAISHDPLPGQVLEAPSCAETERLIVAFARMTDPSSRKMVVEIVEQMLQEEICRGPKH
jgi:transcriptional regulator with XRE-family HTH domain